MDIRKNDNVKVLSGKEKGKTGRVLEIVKERTRVRVEKIMTVKRHLKKGRNQATPEGGIVERFGTLNISNVMVVCPKCNEATRVKHVVREKDGRRVRACKQCNQAWE
jgi:large subunit ribosomal protein L24